MPVKTLSLGKAQRIARRAFRNYLARGLGLLLVSGYVQADLSDLDGSFSIELEERAAQANQETYDQLKSGGCTDTQRSASSDCSGLVFISWESVRELVHTANELLGSGPTEFSLGTDLEGLGFALRWTAGEEFSAQGTMANGFVGGQLSGLASRISALRYGSTGFAFNAGNDTGILIASRYLDGMRGGGAGDPAWSPWGSFMNFNYVFGDRDPTGLEDAFDFEGYQINGGVDYRLDNKQVVGLMLGLQRDKIDFDSSLSIVDGDVEMTGYSLQPFYLFQQNELYFSASLGLQLMSFEMNRRISYPSLNPNVDSTNTTAQSDSDAMSLSSSLTVGYAVPNLGAFGLEPYLSLDYRDITVDGYTETDINQAGFDFVVDEQNLDSLESAIGLKMNWVLSTEYGVYVPVIDHQFRIEHRDDARDIRAYYVNASEGLSNLADASFVLPTDAPDDSYQVTTLGVSAVLRGAQQVTDGGSALGGISAYLNYKWFTGLSNLSQNHIAGGLRYEF